MARTLREITHEFANVVTVIRGNADLMKNKLETYHPARTELADIVRASEEAAQLVRELRSHVDDESAQRKPS